VGSFQANGFGLHDTAGNAWIADGRCTQRVLRGGSWISIPRFVRSGDRSKINTDARIYRNGFRVALSLFH
jgi:formylglycine-generating enzyme required for sulfatase activity